MSQQFLIYKVRIHANEGVLIDKIKSQLQLWIQVTVISSLSPPREFLSIQITLCLFSFFPYTRVFYFLHKYKEFLPLFYKEILAWALPLTIKNPEVSRHQLSNRCLYVITF